MNNRFNELSMELTQKCVLKCIYCSSEAGIDKEKNLELKRIIEIIQEVKNSFGVNTISLSGGESFLYPDFWELFDYLKENEMHIKIYTSGIIIEGGENIHIPKALVKELKIERGNPEIIVNIQGYNKDSIEKINGIPGSYKIIKESINNIKNERIFLGANVVPFKLNFQDMGKIYNFCLKNGFNQINFLRFVPQGRGRVNDFDLTPIEFMELQKKLIKLLKQNKDKKETIDIRIGHPINFLFLLGKDQLYRKEKIHYCRGGLDAPLILPNGDVVMCPAWKDLTQFCAGNIYKQSFDEIWNSHGFNLFRNFIKEFYKEDLMQPCNNCRYLEECRGKCVAQRLLAQEDRLINHSLEESISYAPDPQCFRDLLR